MDCTYKTNEFEMPLLNVVGVTGMNTTIHLAHTFMAGQATADYEWRITQLKQVLESEQFVSLK